MALMMSLPAMSDRPSHREYRLKRVIDVSLAAIMLFLLSPVILVTAAAVKLESRGPVFFRQARWGRDGSRFLIHKFRTMTAAPDEGVPAFLDDPRVTRVGRWLRRTGLDELPQVINILRGEMSFVGPRPLAVGETFEAEGVRRSYEDFPGFRERLAVRPGLTSLATIYLSKDVEPGRKVEADLEYIRRQSLALDLKLIVLSIAISLRARWESRTRKV